MGNVIDKIANMDSTVQIVGIVAAAVVAIVLIIGIVVAVINY